MINFFALHTIRLIYAFYIFMASMKKLEIIIPNGRLADIHGALKDIIGRERNDQGNLPK
jgi:hypothetical protein